MGSFSFLDFFLTPEEISRSNALHLRHGIPLPKEGMGVRPREREWEWEADLALQEKSPQSLKTFVFEPFPGKKKEAETSGAEKTAFLFPPFKKPRTPPVKRSPSKFPAKSPSQPSPPKKEKEKGKEGSNARRRNRPVFLVSLLDFGADGIFEKACSATPGKEKGKKLYRTTRWEAAEDPRLLMETTRRV